MAERKFSMDEYIDVAERLQDFKDSHPDGSLQTISWEVVDIGGKTFVVYRAAAYRTPDDERPGMGIAWEPFPGGTPYTKNSELMNAETAAWGRAIVALGLAANRKLASRQEVRARVEEQEAAAADRGGSASSSSSPAKAPKPKPLSKPRVEELRALVTQAGWDADKLRWGLLAVGVEDVDNLKTAIPALTSEQADALKTALDEALTEASA